MSIIKLRNGSEEDKGLIKALTVSLSGLCASNPIALYELVECCRDRSHKPWGETGTLLSRFGLMLSDGTIHESVRNVVLSSVAGEGLELKLDSPFHTAGETAGEIRTIK